MQQYKLLALSLIAALYAGQTVAAETAAPSAAKTPAVKAKAHHHHKDCHEVSGKPCAVKDVKVAPVAATVAPVNAATAVAIAAPVVSAVSAAPVAAAVEPVVPAVAAISEADGLALAKKSNCLTCHAIDKKVVGPAWKDVAAKYRGDATAEARLAGVIAAGGKGNWGSMAMPASPKVSEADRKSLAQFVLNLK